MSYYLDQQATGLFNIIDEDGRTVSYGIATRAEAYAIINLLEKQA